MGSSGSAARAPPLWFPLLLQALLDNLRRRGAQLTAQWLGTQKWLPDRRRRTSGNSVFRTRREKAPFTLLSRERRPPSADTPQADGCDRALRRTPIDRPRNPHAASPDTPEGVPAPDPTRRRSPFYSWRGEAHESLRLDRRSKICAAVTSGKASICWYGMGGHSRRPIVRRGVPAYPVPTRLRAFP
jgi:hypothetical protein